MTGLLFDDRVRRDPNPKYAAETSFQFLQRVDDPVFARIRETFNAWFARFAERQSERAVNDLRGRFGSRQDHQFYAGFWELYLHEVFARLGFEVEVHPTGESDTRPDFLVSREAQRFYVEAVMPMPSTGEDQQPKSVATVLEYVDAAFDPDFYVAVRFVTAGAETPRRRAVVAAVEDWLGQLRWDDYRDESGMRQPGREVELNIGDWVIGLIAMPRSPKARGDRSFPTIGIYPGTSAWVEPVVATVGPTLEEKAGKYGDLDAPYLIAAWVMSAIVTESSLAQALFGVALPVDPGRHDISMPGELFGLWTPNRQRRDRVSAVLLAGSFDFNYSAVARVMPRLWLNPRARRELTVSLPFASSRVSADEAWIENTVETLPASELLGLPADWPGVPFQRL
jgi:hypothetical protein